jgi:hypothetical protein
MLQTLKEAGGGEEEEVETIPLCTHATTTTYKT